MAPADIDPPQPDANNLDFQPLPRSEQPQKRWGLRMFMLFVFLAGGATAGWFGLTEFGAQAPVEIPTVRADPAPIKVRPESPGGKQVPNQDKKVYGLIQGKGKGEAAQPESLLPPPETPLPAPKPAVSEPQKVASAPIPPKVVAKVPPPEAPATTAPQAPEPARSEVPPQPKVPTQEEVVAAKPPPPLPKAPAPKETPRQPLSTETAAETAAATARAPATATKTAATNSGPAFTIQLAAVRSPVRANEEWGRLRKKHADLLGKLTLSIVKADLGAKKGIFYRLRAGPVATEAAAKSLCLELAKRKVGCLVVRPGR
jgi:hypothetical protein